MAETNEVEDSEYKKQLGLVGLQLMRIADKNAMQPRSGNDYPRDNRSIAMQGTENVFETNVVEIDQSVAFQLAEAFRANTFKVRIVGAFNDIISPLNERLRILQADAEQANMQRHHESSLYNDKILSALLTLESGNSEQNRGIYLATKEFLRNPIWNSIKATLQGLWAVTKVTGGILFGFKKELSDTDRIVNAIEKQTEWMMTKQIGQQAGFFERLARQGILGMSARGLANLGLSALGVGRDRAQADEDRKSRGEATSGGFGEWFSSFVYGDDVDLKGRNQGTAADPSAEQNVHDLRVFQQLKLAYKEHEQCCEVTHSMMAAGLGLSREEFAFNRTKIEKEEKKEELMIEMFKDQRSGIYSVAKNTKETFKEVRKSRIQALWGKLLGFAGSIFSTITKTGLSLAKMALSLIPLKGLGGLLARLGTTIVTGFGTKILPLASALLGKGAGLLKTGAKAAGGAIKTVAQAGGSVLKTGYEAGKGLLSRGVAAGGKVLSSGGSMLKNGMKVVGGGIQSAASGAGNLLSKGGAAIKGMSPLAKGAGVGALVGIGGDLAADALGRDTKLGAGADVLGQTATYASTGALIGSFIPGLGTAIGAAIGGAIGAGKGLYDNRETLFGENTPVEAAKNEEMKLASDLGNKLMEDLNKKSEETIKALKESAKNSDAMVSTLKGILENTKVKAGDFVSPLANTGMNTWTTIGGKG